jgi:hypothetical protein
MRRIAGWVAATLVGATSIVAQGCGGQAVDRAPTGDECPQTGRGFGSCKPPNERPLLFITGGANKTVTLRAARTDGVTAVLAEQELSDDEYWDSYGPRDRAESFASLSPWWRNMSVSPDGGWVLWRRKDGSFRVLDTDQGRDAELPSTNFDERVLVWSPDGASFVALDRTTCTLEAVTPAEGRTATLASFGLAACAGSTLDLHVSWAPDGSRIAYERRGPTSDDPVFVTGELHTIAPDGTKDLTIGDRASVCRNGKTTNFAQPFSADGARIAYATAVGVAGESDAKVEFRTAAADGSDPVVVFTLPLADYLDVAGFARCEWSPTDDRLLIGTPAGTFTVTARGEELTALAAGVGFPFYTGFSWSADGSRVNLQEIVEDTLHVATLRFDGTERFVPSTTHVPDNTSFVWTWSPDGAKGLHATRKGLYTSDLQLYDLAAGRDVALIDPYDRFAWTPDGSRAVYERETVDLLTPVASVLPDGSDEWATSVPYMSMYDLTWLSGGQHWAGADHDGLWIQKFRDPERVPLWKNSEEGYLVEVAFWDHDEVWY